MVYTSRTIVMFVKDLPTQIILSGIILTGSALQTVRLFVDIQRNVIYSVWSKCIVKIKNGTTYEHELKVNWKCPQGVFFKDNFVCKDGRNTAFARDLKHYYYIIMNRIWMWSFWFKWANINFQSSSYSDFCCKTSCLIGVPDLVTQKRIW